MATKQIIYATTAQKQYLHGLKRLAFWDDDQYYFVLKNNYGVDTSSDLTISQAHELIAILKGIVDGGDVWAATPKQITLIRANWLPIDYSKGEHGDLHLNALIQKKFGKQDVEHLTKKEAIKLINIIAAMTKQAKDREGKTTVLNRQFTCDLCGEPIMWVQLKSGERVAFNIDKPLGKEKPKATSFHNCKK